MTMNTLLVLPTENVVPSMSIMLKIPNIFGLLEVFQRLGNFLGLPRNL